MLIAIKFAPNLNVFCHNYGFFQVTAKKIEIKCKYFSIDVKILKLFA